MAWIVTVPPSRSPPATTPAAEASEQMKQALIQAVSLGENPRVAAKHMVEAVQGASSTVASPAPR